MPKSVIITCAASGGIHTPTMSPYLPITAAEITDTAVGRYRGRRYQGRCRNNPSTIRGIIEALGYSLTTADEARQRRT